MLRSYVAASAPQRREAETTNRRVATQKWESPANPKARKRMKIASIATFTGSINKAVMGEGLPS